MARSERFFLGAALAAVMLLVPAAAQLGIHPAILPQAPGVLAAYQTVVRLDPMTRSWRAHWAFPTPKAQVQQQLTTALAALGAAGRAAAGNEELALLTAVTAADAYNLDVPGAWSLAVASFRRAARLAPADPRPVWMLGRFYCQTQAIARGMEILLAAEHHGDPAGLPAAFWRVYMSCALETAMPMHVLRAENLARRAGPLSAAENEELKQARGLIRQPSATGTYAPGDVWRARQTTAGITYSSVACGLSLPAGNNWNWEFSGLQQGACAVKALLGPFPGKSGQVTPEVLILVQPDSAGGLGAFAARYARGMGAHAAPPAACPPAANCLGYRAEDRNSYAAEGGGEALLTVFAARGPRFPGLLFEHPESPPTGKGRAIQYFRLQPVLGRLAETLDYLVLLDTARSVQQPAVAQYAELLRGLRPDTVPAASESPAIRPRAGRHQNNDAHRTQEPSQKTSAPRRADRAPDPGGRRARVRRESPTPPVAADYEDHPPLAQT